MSKLREKSEFNFDAAQVLIKNNLFAPSVHCSYYSCFQLMKYTMNYVFGISYDELNTRISVTAGGTHSYVTNFFNKEVKKKSITDYSDFSRKIKTHLADNTILVISTSRAYNDVTELNTLVSKKNLIR